MLAQSFMTAADLGLTEPQKAALIKTLVLLETGKMTHAPTVPDMNAHERHFSGHFNMCNWRGKHECGTVACIGGTAELVGDVSFGYIYSIHETNRGLSDLFLPRHIPASEWSCITPSHAARALRSYLTTGNARWDLAIA